MKRKLSFLLPMLLLVGAPWVYAQDSPAPKPADPADVASVDAIIKAVYASISGPAGPRQWDRLRTLFAPGARLIPVQDTPQQKGVMRALNVEEYITTASAYFDNNGFFEIEVFRTEERYGRIVHAFSTYESRHNADDAEPFIRGINSIQLMFDGDRWWVVTVLWNHENETRPIPAKYLPQ